MTNAVAVTYEKDILKHTYEDAARKVLGIVVTGQREFARSIRVLFRNDVRERFHTVRSLLIKNILPNLPSQILHKVFNMLRNQYISDTGSGGIGQEKLENEE